MGRKALSVLSPVFAINVIIIFIIIYSSILLSSHYFKPHSMIESPEDEFIQMNRTFSKI